MADKETERVTLTLVMDIPLHRKTWQILTGIQKGKRTEYICKKIVGQQNEQEFADIIYENTLKALNHYNGRLQAPATETNMDEAEEIENNLFGFLSSLE